MPNPSSTVPSARTRSAVATGSLQPASPVPSACVGVIFVLIRRGWVWARTLRMAGGAVNPGNHGESACIHSALAGARQSARTAAGAVFETGAGHVAARELHHHHEGGDEIGRQAAPVDGSPDPG